MREKNEWPRYGSICFIQYLARRDSSTDCIIDAPCEIHPIDFLSNDANIVRDLS